MRLIDAHGHLNADRFDDDLDAVLDRALAAGVERILVPGWNVRSSERALELAARRPWLDVAVGVHPHDAAKVDAAGWAAGDMAEFPDYHLFRNGERSGGAIGRRGQSTGQVIRLYITVDSLEEACAAAEANGGAVLEQPSDIGGGMGRFAVVRDTEGSEVGLWQSTGEGAG
ncbi:MAG: hypothetical protein A2V85_01610 [Chloroflexi bacterium RBG_16_72_14]|nr:MAG: hypothetical protein A2V85_01610 [Chloroflexi bacterium RBG_16_72_14]